MQKEIRAQEIHLHWLVVSTPLKICKSVGMIIPNIWKNKAMFQTTNQYKFVCHVCPRGNRYPASPRPRDLLRGFTGDSPAETGQEIAHLFNIFNDSPIKNMVCLEMGYCPKQPKWIGDYPVVDLKVPYFQTNHHEFEACFSHHSDGCWLSPQVAVTRTVYRQSKKLVALKILADWSGEFEGN